ncbi:MAG TPA: MG2 domain-containing protein [Tepidisphaeraceae bacterium]|jgi:hypothetical protein|nr:MG2 domain-containing protein [Tepidisphaeraceae bacterium]
MSTRITAPAGGRRFWVTVLCFAIANLAIWVSFIQWQKIHRHHLLEITQFTPGDGALVQDRPVLCWSFNLDVAAPAQNNPPPGQISPAIAGKWEWPDARTLKFTPDVPLPKATPITVTLNADALHTPDGFRLAKPYVASLHTEPLQVMEARQISYDDGNHVILKLTFNDKVLPADVVKHLSLRGTSGKPLPFHANGQAAGRTVRVMTEALPAAELNGFGHELSIDLRVEKGLAGEAGPLGLENDFDQRVTIASYLEATDATAHFPASDDAFVQIRFNNSVDEDAIRQVLSLTPAVPYTIAMGSNGVDLHGPFQPGTRYAIKIAAPPAGAAARRMPRPTTLSVLVPDRNPGLWFESQVGYLSAEGNRTVMAHAVNVTNLRATVTRIYDNNLVAWRNQRSGYMRNDIDSYARPVAVRDFHLPTRKNEKQDIRIALDDLLPAGEARDGVYRISLSSMQPGAPLPRWSEQDESEDNDGDDYGRSYGGASTVVSLSDIGLSAKEGKDGLIVWATSLRTAKPLPNIHARVFSNKNQLLGEAMTNASGLATIVMVPAAPGEKAAVVIADQPASVEVRDALPERQPEARGAAAHQAAEKSAAQGLTWLDLREGAVNFGDSDIDGRAFLRHGFEAFVYTDRGVYRPGETVHLRAIVRGPDNATPPRFPIRWQIRRPDLHDWKSQMGEIDADGATSFDLQLPADLPSGRWTAHVGLPGETGSSARFFGMVAFDIEDFMPQRMKVSVEIGTKGAKENAKAPERIALGEDSITARVQADYLFGRPVSERPASLVVRVDPIPFQPKGLGEWTFGDAANTAEPLGHTVQLGRRAELPIAELDAKGQAKWDVNVIDLIENGELQNEDADKPMLASARHRGSHRRTRSAVAGAAGVSANSDYTGPWRLTMTGSVTETGGRAITASRQIDLDRTPYYIGLKARETSPRPGVAANYDVQLVTPAGAVAATNAKLEFTLMRETWNNSYTYENSHFSFHSTRILETIGNGPKNVAVTQGRGEIAIVPPAGGSYVLIARDTKTGCLTSIGFYAGYGMWQDNISRQNPERLDLVVQPMPATTLLDGALQAIGNGDIDGLLALPERITALPPRDGKLHIGQAAQVIVRSPFPGKLLLAVETDGVISTQVLDMPENHIAVPIQLSDACRPNAYVTATVIRPIDPNAKWAVHRAIGVQRIAIDNGDRKLGIQLATPAEIRPQASLGVQVRVVDSAGNPVPNAAVTVAAVDEGICQLTDFKTPDPFAFFTAKRALGVHSSDLFGQLMPETPAPEKQSAVGGDEDSAFGLKRGSPVSARRVRPVALVSNVLHTDAQGVAHADFSTPEFNGQLRVMAVASADNRFGSIDGPVLVRSPLLVQSSWPRFAAPSDRFAVPLTIFNNGKTGGQAEITIEVDGPLQITGDAKAPGEKPTAHLSLPPILISAGGQATAAFNIIALDEIGVAHAHLIAKMGDEMYEENIELPVRPASPTITDGAYLLAKTNAPAKVEIPAGFVDGTTRYELRVSATQQLQLPEGLDYLDHYPYGCLEQTTSTLFPLVYLNDVGEQIAPGLFDKSRVTDKVQVGMSRLLSMQTADGGLAMWPGERQDWEWGSVYAAHFLVEAQAAGYEVPEELRDPLLLYVRGLLNQPEKSSATIELQSYAAYVLALAGKPPRPIMDRLGEVLKTENAGSARFHLAAAWLAAGRRDLAAGLIPSDIPAPRANRDLSGNVGSAIRDRAILISTMLAVSPDDPRIGGLVQQLADSGRAHQWRSTQDTAFAVMAIGRYLRHAKTQAPYETAELLLDGKSIASAEGGKPLIWNATTIDDAGNGRPEGVRLPPAGSKLEVRITGQPTAIAHVAWLETGVKTKPPASADNGMTIRRRYLDEHGKPLEAMQVRSGDLVQVELKIQAASALDNLVIEDLLPAGLEIENPRLLGNAAGVPVAPHARAARVNEDGDNAPAFASVRADMRDDRLILVGHLTQAGTGTYLYTARAVTAGKYVLPPVKGECMYDSGVNSLSGAGTFEVLPAGALKVARAGN